MIDYLEKIRHKIFQERLDLLKEVRNIYGGKKMIFTNGCFDLLHRGHIDYLARARNLGDYLIVGLNSDQSVAENKGANRPIKQWSERSFILAALECIDYIVYMPEKNPADLINILKPNIHCKGGDYKPEELIEFETVKKNGGQIKILSFVANYSTSHLIKQIEKRKHV